ncbi:unnamed protein product [Mytilus coruscus]|uniref:ShKT domain-containing protein n=1 Tax=Mytilus coruscus TaxID=42192 RepID=A0A6J8B0U8_MYTCO|nr:unnamed protein product [Mytilus coruscus]
MIYKTLLAFVILHIIVDGHTNPPPDKDFVCDTYPCHNDEICRLNNINGAIRGQCMSDPSQHGINVSINDPSQHGINVSRNDVSQHGVPTLNPLCIDHDTRCASFKDQLCHATAHAYVIATCARTCNRCDEYIAPASTIQQTTSTTTTPKTTPRTLQPTTSAASLTTDTRPVKCNTCGDIDNYIPCFSRDVFRNQSSDCPAGHNFCMTDIFTDADGNSDLFKRCVTEQTCNAKWTNDSAKFDYCRKYGVVTSDNAYECHFCCTGDGCNTNIKPSDTTLVVPHAFLIVGK